MAKLYTCHSFYDNQLLIDQDEFTRKALTKDNITSTSTSTVSYTPTPVSTLVLGLLDIYPDIDLQKVTKLMIKLFIKG